MIDIVVSGAAGEQIERDLRRVTGPIQKKAARSAIRSTTRKVRTEAARKVAAQSNLPQRAVKKRLKLRYSRGGVIGATLTALLARVLGHDIGTAKQQKKGVRVGRHTFPGGFKVDSLGGRGFLRKSDSSLPIREVGVELGEPANRVVKIAVQTVGAREWPREFANKMQFFLRGR